MPLKILFLSSNVKLNSLACVECRVKKEMTRVLLFFFTNLAVYLITSLDFVAGTIRRQSSMTDVKLRCEKVNP